MDGVSRYLLMVDKICSVESCENLSRARGLCRHHYNAQWDKAHPDVIKQRGAKWRQDHPDDSRVRMAQWRMANLDKVKAYTASYYRENADRCRAASAKWARVNPERQRINQLRFYEAHPMALVLAAHLRRVRKYANGNFKVTSRDLHRLLVRSDWCCAYC